MTDATKLYHVLMKETEEIERDEKFYSLDFRRYGVDIPPRLDDICNDKKTMLYAQQSLQQIEKEYTCNNCHKAYIIYKPRRNLLKFCSLECRYEFRIQNPDLFKIPINRSKKEDSRKAEKFAELF